jgi:hypothetical protein
MANIDKPNGFKAVQNLAGGMTFPLWTADTTSNLTLSAGDALVMLSNGTINIATASSAALCGVAQHAVAGATGVRKPIKYIPALPNIVFSGQCSGTMTPVNMGEFVDIEGTTGIMEVDENAQTTNVLRVLALEGGLNNAAGANARVLFIIAKSQFTGQ